MFFRRESNKSHQLFIAVIQIRLAFNKGNVLDTGGRSFLFGRWLFRFWRRVDHLEAAFVGGQVSLLAQHVQRPRKGLRGKKWVERRRELVRRLLGFHVFSGGWC